MFLDDRCDSNKHHKVLLVLLGIPNLGGLQDLLFSIRTQVWPQYISLALLAVTDTDASVFWRIATLLTIQNSHLLLLLSWWFSELILTSKSVCDAASAYDCGTYFSINSLDKSINYRFFV